MIKIDWDSVVGTSLEWYGIQISSEGKIQIAIPYEPGFIYFSNDYGLCLLILYNI